MRLIGRRTKRLRIAFCLVVLSALSIASTGLAWAFVVLTLVGAIIAVHQVVQILKHPDDLTAFRALAVALLAGYFLGPSLSIVLWRPGAGVNPVVLAGPFAYHGYLPSLSLAIAVAYAATAVLLAGDQLARGLGRLGLDRLRFAKKDAAFLLAMAALVIMALSNGDLGYMGTRVHSDDTVSFLGSLGGTVLPGLVPVYLMAVLAKSSARLWRTLYFVLLLTLGTVLVIQGRRVIIFAVLTALVLARLCVTRTVARSSPAGPRLRRRSVLAFALAGGFILFGLFYFTALRIATDQRGPNTSLDLRSELALQVLHRDRVGFFSFASAQAGARSGTLPGYLGALLESNSGRRFMGECLLANTITAIPRALLPDKSYWTDRYSCTDEHVNAVFALPQIDSPTTLLTQGYVDFGWFGALIYPLLIGAILQLVLRLVRLSGVLSIKAFILSSVVFASLFVEQSLSFYLVSVRNLGIVLALSSPLWLGNSVRSRIQPPSA